MVTILSSFGKYKVILGALLITVLLFMLPVSGAESPGSLIPSSGSIRYPSSVGTTFGWGGFVKTTSQVGPLLDRLKNDGWNSVRYQSIPPWASPDWGTYTINHVVLRYLIDQARQRGMYVVLDLAHNFWSVYGNPPGGFPGFYIDGHEQDWINQYIIDATPYKNDQNIVLEIANEYGGSVSHQTQIVTYFNDMISALRSNGFNQVIQANFWWNQQIVTLNDPLENYMVGLHYYGQAFDNYNPSTPIDYATACQQSGVNQAIQRIFSGPVARAKSLGLRFLVTELGASWNHSDTTIPGGYVYSVGGIAYVMKFLEYAKKNDVSVVMHRIGSYSDYDVYYTKAADYFGKQFWPIP